MKNCVSKLFAIKIRDNWFYRFDRLKASLWFSLKKFPCFIPKKKKKKKNLFATKLRTLYKSPSFCRLRILESG